MDVKGTPMDFTKPKAIGSDLQEDYEQIKEGYNHTWVLNSYGSLSEKAAELVDENSERVMEIYTTKPGLQFNSGGFLKETSIGKENVFIMKMEAYALQLSSFLTLQITKTFHVQY